MLMLKWCHRAICYRIRRKKNRDIQNFALTHFFSATMEIIALVPFSKCINHYSTNKKTTKINGAMHYGSIFDLAIQQA